MRRHTLLRLEIFGASVGCLRENTVDALGVCGHPGICAKREPIAHSSARVAGYNCPFPQQFSTNVRVTQVSVHQAVITDSQKI